MRLEDLKDQYPKTPGFISEMIEKEVEKQIHTQKSTGMRQKEKAGLDSGKNGHSGSSSLCTHRNWRLCSG